MRLPNKWIVFACFIVSALAAGRAWGQSLIQITSPGDGSTAYRGSSVAIQFTADPSVSNIAVQAGFVGGWTSQASGPGLYTLNIPATTPIEEYQVYVVGTSGGNVVSSAPITLHVDTPYGIGAIQTKPEVVRLDAIGDTLPLSIIAQLTDGSTDLVTYSSRISFTSNNTSVATVDGRGNVTAVSAGATFITVNGGPSPYNVFVKVAAPAVKPPAFSPPPGHYATATQVQLASPTAGAKIYYTTNGKLPTAKSSLYTSPINVAATATIEALAVAAGSPNSLVVSGIYMIGTPTSAPTITPGTGTYSDPQQVDLTDATTGAVIYYTLDNTAPTIHSAKYSGPITISTNATLKAIAVADGYTPSPVTSATYTFTSGQCTTIDYSKGFTTAGLSLNGGATVTNGALQLTDGGFFEARSGFYTTAVPVTNYTTDFTFQLVNPLADGITFTIQSAGPQEVGAAGGGLGYAGIPKSAAVKLDLFDNDGEGFDSTGLYFDGAYPSTPATNLFPAGIHLHSGHVFAVHIAYENQTATGTITDMSTSQSAGMSVPGDLSKIVGDTAYVGFTGATGDLTAQQKILTWTFSSGTGCSQK